MGNDVRFAEAARHVGTLLGGRGLAMVYGGAHVGLMGIVADAALIAGAEVIGVLPRGLETKEVAHRGLTNLIVTNGMHERKARMYELADVFLILPGGFGTMDEMFEILTWRQLGDHGKPVGLLNVAEFYTPLVTFLDHQVETGLLRAENRKVLHVDHDADRLLDRLLVGD